MQDEFNDVLAVLKNLNNAENVYDARDITINAFKHKIFQYYQEGHFEERDEIRDEIGLINNDKLKRQTYLRERDQNDELIKKQFMVQNLRLLLKT